MADKKIGYSEPTDYFPKSVRKQFEKTKTEKTKKVKRTKKK